jgi:hypothetical protein
MKVFISWSSSKSGSVAKALRDWLPQVINSVQPFVSASDIDSGSRWQAELASELDSTNYGIVCVTRDNQIAPWLNFEAGALAKAVVDRARVVPLAVDLPLSELKAPLSQFQAQRADKGGLSAIVSSMNAAADTPLQEKLLTRAFEKWWPDLARELEQIEDDARPLAPAEQRTEREMVEEILETVRHLARDEVDDATTSALAHGRPPPVKKFRLGASVAHRTFGLGRVITIEPDGVIQVRFVDGTIRKLMADYAPINEVEDEASP